MKNILFAVFLLAAGHTWGQPITEEGYVKEGNALWGLFTSKCDTLEQSVATAKDKEEKDSLIAAYDELYRQTVRQNGILALKYAATPSGLQGCFTLRLGLPDDSLRAVLKRIPKQMRRSPYGRAIALHLSCPKVRPGDKAYDFQATDAQGRPFRLRQWKGKQILLLYGGLGCMGPWGREYLGELYGRTSRENLEIVVFWPTSGQDELTALAKEYPSEFLQVSDFKGDVTPVKIRYEAQATPTCFLIGRDGRLLVKSVGLSPEEFESAMK